MLFSDEAVARFINDHFEPTWESLRPVPQVTIDFGNGEVVRRTLHGNIATWVCAADGTAIDVLPGMYVTETYVRELETLHATHADFLVACKTPEEQFLRDYYQRKIRAGDSFEEIRVEPGTLPEFPAIGRKLVEDTRFNQSVRRREIYEHLVTVGPTSPTQQTHWLYREILNADLDDPWLGLGETLFANYPFAEEDAR